MNIVLINQFFPPAQAPTGLLLADLAAELARRGHAVTVLASAAGYGAASGADGGWVPGVRVVRIGPAQRHGTGAAAKLRDYLSFHRGVRAELTCGALAPEALVCMTTPPFIGLQAAQLRKVRGLPYVLWCMDLYPEALAAHGWLRDWNPLRPLLREFARIERSRAAAVVALGPDMAALLAVSGAVGVVEIPVWDTLSAPAAAAGASRELRHERSWREDEIILLYSGNMGRAHRAEEFAALAERLRGATPRCRFVFSGDGPQRAEWEGRWGGLVEFMPPVPADARAAHLLAADVHLVSQQPEWRGVVVPSKFQAACTLGRPVVFAGPPDSAVGIWLKAADAGWIVPPGDGAAIGAAAEGVRDARVRQAKGRRARELGERRFAPAHNCDKLATLVEQVARERT